MLKTLNDWLQYIHTIHTKRMDFGLDRIGAVADRLQVQRFSCPVITVVGTNGKGSCVKTLESIYTEAGYKTGLYMSPHLLVFNERIRLNNQNISDQALIQAFETVEKARGETVLSFFEFTTLAALLIFKNAVCDVLILEAGLGGRLDAVNIIDHDVAIVTSIALDHVNWLGETRDHIAFEKVSIARANRPFICGDRDPPKSVETIVKEKQACLYQIGRDFNCFMDAQYFRCWSVQFDYLCFPKPLLKTENVACSLMAVTLLQSRLPVSVEQMQQGVKHVHLPGRFEQCAQPFSCVFDVAHNPASGRWLAEQYAQLHKQKTLAVVGMLGDKDMRETVAPLLSLVDRWHVAKLSVYRGSDGSTIKNFLQAQGVHCYNFESVSAALSAIENEYRSWRILVFGSFHTVAEAKQWMMNDDE